MGMNPQREPRPGEDSIVVICGGVGAARLLRGLIDVADPQTITAIVNVADDTTLHGLHVSPDLDTVVYTLADAIDPVRGWGLVGESWNAMDSLSRYGERNWFLLGDKDLGTHLQRTARLAEGAPLTTVTAEISRAWNVDVNVLPVTDDRVSTFVTLAESGEDIPFQDYFVGRAHQPSVSGVRFEGIDEATPSTQVRTALAEASTILIAPSNPIVSIAPVVNVPGVREAIASSPATVVAVSPLIGGAAVKGPAAHMMESLGHRADSAGIAALWADLIDLLVIDDADAHLSPDVQSAGVIPVVTKTLMSTPQTRAALAQRCLDATSLTGRTAREARP